MDIYNRAYYDEPQFVNLIISLMYWTTHFCNRLLNLCEIGRESNFVQNLVFVITSQSIVVLYSSWHYFVVGVIVVVVVVMLNLPRYPTILADSKISPQTSMRCEVNLGVFRLTMWTLTSYDQWTWYKSVQANFKQCIFHR